MMDLPEQISHEYRVRYKHAGGHIHMRVFSRRKGQETWAKCGDLVIDETEWVSLVQTFKAEFLEEDF